LYTKGEIIITILWKIYFWLTIGLYLLLIGAFIVIDDTNLFETKMNFFSTTYDILMILISVFSLLGLYGYIFKKKILSQEIWKFIFSLILIDSIGNILYSLLEKDYFFIIVMIIFIPYFYALYKYSFVNENLKVSTNE